MRFKAVAFDLDGTLYPASAINALALPLALGHPLLFAAFAQARKAIRVLARDEAYAASPPRGGPEFMRLQAELTASLLGGGRARHRVRGLPSPDRIDRVEAVLSEVVYRRLPELFSRVAPYRGVEAALDRLARAGLRLAVLSDQPPARKLELLGLAGRFELALCSEDSGYLKPSPEPFRVLLASLGLRSDEVLYVGNSRAYDLEGAKAARMAAAMVSRRPVEGAALSFFDWDELADFALS